MAEGIEVRHARSCVSRDGKRCNCEPGYRAAAYDAISKRKVSKTLRTLGAARRWRAAAQTQAAKGVRLAGTSQTLHASLRQQSLPPFVHAAAPVTKTTSRPRRTRTSRPGGGRSRRRIVLPPRSERLKPPPGRCFLC